MKELCGFLFFMAMMALALASLFTSGFSAGKQSVKQEAVDVGVAKWTVDTRGLRGFEWINATNPEVKP